MTFILYEFISVPLVLLLCIVYQHKISFQYNSNSYTCDFNPVVYGIEILILVQGPSEKNNLLNDHFGSFYLQKDLNMKNENVHDLKRS